MREINPGKENLYGNAVVNLASTLEQVISCIDALGSEFNTERENLAELKSRLVEERFHLAVLGQFKRGKSTLINALLGEKILPSAVVPLTAIPTLIKAGRDKRVKVSFVNGRMTETLNTDNREELSALLAKFVTETENPKNYLGVSQVEVFYPANILTKGVVLIDTPGIGSTYRHNTEATLNFLPQCDAALFVSSADPPITEVEVKFLQEICNKVEHLIFLFNKADYLDEQEKKHALEFFRLALRDAGFAQNLSIYCISARQGLEAKINGDTVKWEQSGLSQLESDLMDFFVSKKTLVLKNAIAKKSAGVFADIKMKLQIMIQSLKMPLDDLDERRQVLVQKIADIERQRIMVEDLLEGDRRRALEHLEQQAENLRQKAHKRLTCILQEHCAVAPKGIPDQRVLAQAIAAEIPSLFENELDAISRTIDAYVAGVLQPHNERAKGLVAEIRRLAAELFAIPIYTAQIDGLFKMKRKPYWVAHQWTSSFRAIPQEWIDKFLPFSIRRARMMKKLEEQIETLVSRNVENLRWETLQNLNDTFRQFAATLRKQLQVTLDATQGAIQTAWEKRQTQQDSVEQEIMRLTSTLTHIIELENNLGVTDSD